MADRATFDLIDEPWLPCVRCDGRRVELGLRAALLGAHELRGLFDPSPPVTVALHRLLLAVLHRAHDGPVDFAEWEALWRGRSAGWDRDRVGGYLDGERERGRFDLFHPERPFFGVPAMAGARMLPVTVLALEEASGNNATLFDHSLNFDPAPVAAAEAARRLVARQAFAFGGGVSKPFNLSDAPLVRDYTVLAFGRTLFETLALNLLVYDEERPIASSPAGDLPAWEQEAARTPDRAGTPPLGYLDYLTWQSRRIHLVPEGTPPRVRWCQLQQGLKLIDDPRRTDPFKAYTRSTEGGRRARKLDPERAVWRDSHALLQHGAEGERRPELFDHLAQVERARRADRIAAAEVYAFGVFGLATVPGRASVELWRQERLPLPLAYLDNRRLTNALEDALKLADTAAQALDAGIRELARLLLSPVADQRDARQPPAAEVRRLVRCLDAELPFWTRLETAFVRLLVELPQHESERAEDEPIFAREIRADWLDTLRRTARDAFEVAVADLDHSGWTLKATTEAWDRFERELRRRLPEVADSGTRTGTHLDVEAGRVVEA